MAPPPPLTTRLYATDSHRPPLLWRQYPSCLSFTAPAMACCVSHTINRRGSGCCLIVVAGTRICVHRTPYYLLQGARSRAHNGNGFEYYSRLDVYYLIIVNTSIYDVEFTFRKKIIADDDRCSGYPCRYYWDAGNLGGRGVWGRNYTTKFFGVHDPNVYK